MLFRQNEGFNMQFKNINKHFIISAIFIGCITVFRLIYSNFVNLAPDEALYWDWTRHLNLSYFDHPPLTTYLIYLSTKLFGSNEFGVRFFTILFSCLNSFLVYLISKKVFNSDKQALSSVILFNLLPIFTVGSIIITPDTPLMFFWLLNTFLIAQLITTNNKNYWYLIGATFGLSMLGKYSTVIFLISFILFIFIDKPQQKWLAAKEFYFSAIIALIIFLPVIIWNIQNDWVSFKFQTAHGLTGGEVQPWNNFCLYLAGQLLILNPLIFLGIILSVFWCWQNWRRERNEQQLFFSLLTVIPIIFFALTSFRAKVEANWPATGYLAGTIILVGWYYKQVTNKRLLYKLFLQSLAVITIILVTLFSSLLYFPGILYSSGFKLNHEPTDELYGWKELAAQVNTVYQQMQSKNQTYLLTNRYQIAAETAFYIPGRPQVICVNVESRPNAYELFYQQDMPIGSDAILIAGPDKQIREYYQSVTELPKIDVYRYGILKHKYILHQCLGYKGGLIKIKNEK